MKLAKNRNGRDVLFLITSRLNIRSSLRFVICIVCYVTAISFVKSGNNLVDFKKKKVEMLGVSTLFY